VHEVVVVPSNKHVATISSDRSVRLWKSSELLDKNHTFIRINIDYDYPSSIAFTVDSKSDCRCAKSCLLKEIFQSVYCWSEWQ
jgi:WD40 repeat protein